MSEGSEAPETKPSIRSGLSFESLEIKMALEGHSLNKKHRERAPPIKPMLRDAGEVVKKMLENTKKIKVPS